ncbi:hypothetical protein GCM10027073_33180 [Streptomyces chlorus]|uniref:Transposase n=1 Tax=Streptomyces chlorus TaxID=887452 RepID=A0ABW1E3Q4_9ACTN
MISTGYRCPLYDGDADDTSDPPVQHDQLQDHPRPVSQRDNAFRLYHQPARLAHHARRHHLRLDPSWRWTSAFVLAWKRLTDLPAVT